MKIRKDILRIAIIVIILANMGIILNLFSSSENSFLCSSLDDCNVVRGSEYSILMGVELEKIGLLGFSLLAISYIFSTKTLDYRLTLGLSFLGALFAIYLIYVQLFLVGNICYNCMLIDFLAIVLFVLLFIEKSAVSISVSMSASQAEEAGSIPARRISKSKKRK